MIMNLAGFVIYAAVIWKHYLFLKQSQEKNTRKK